MNLSPQPQDNLEMQKTKSQVPNLVSDLSKMDGKWCGYNLLAAESWGLAGLLRPGKARPDGCLTLFNGLEPTLSPHTGSPLLRAHSGIFLFSHWVWFNFYMTECSC